MYALLFLSAITLTPADDAAAVYHVNHLPGDGLPGVIVEATLPAGHVPAELKIVHEKTSREKRLSVARTQPMDGGVRYTAMMADKEWSVPCYPNDNVRVLVRLGDSWHEVGEARVRYTRPK